jgi:hypothetical protein
MRFLYYAFFWSDTLADGGTYAFAHTSQLIKSSLLARKLVLCQVNSARSSGVVKNPDVAQRHVGRHNDAHSPELQFAHSLAYELTAPRCYLHHIQPVTFLRIYIFVVAFTLNHWLRELS